MIRGWSPVAAVAGQIVAQRSTKSCVSKRWFIDLQTALAIDILLHVPPRIENLAHSSSTNTCIGRRVAPNRRFLSFGSRRRRTRARSSSNFRYLSDRLYAYRNEIAPAVIGRRPDFLFISRKGVRRTLCDY